MPAQGQQVMDAILFHPQTSMRRALILALGQYGQEGLSPDDREALIDRFLDLYKTDPDAGIHGATEWTLRQWGQQESVKQLDAELMKVKDWGDRRWFVNSQGQTFAVIEGPVEFSMGSPHSEPDRRDSENLHRKRINRRFAVATKEVSVEQYQRFLKENPKIARLEIDRRFSPEPTGPMNRMTWYEAAAYCNWLSQQEGLATCYEPNDEGEFAEGMKIVPDALKQPGYRLPTEAEWEYACRAGAVTSRYYGRSVELLGKYAWYLQNSQERAWPCGQLLPNELGLFDMLGNVYEWCREQYYRYPEGEGNTTTDDINISLSINEKDHRLLRGGAFGIQPAYVRSANRDGIAPATRDTGLGFRPSRTYR
jgi:formylglycine-generating enzyme required for sulfatase activity